jgi:hypothetical protein
MRQKIVVLILMLAASAFIAIAAVSIGRSLRIRKHGLLTEGTIVEVIHNARGIDQYKVTFTTAGGNQITGTARSLQHASEGDKVNIWYDQKAPEKIDFGNTIKYDLRGAIVGGFLFIFGLYYFTRYSVSESSDKKLVRSGRKISADFVSVGRNERYRMGDNNPWVIKCKWTDSRNNQEYQFASKDYTIDPGPYLEGRYHIDIYIDPADPARYFMDTSFMPEGDNNKG